VGRGRGCLWEEDYNEQHLRCLYTPPACPPPAAEVCRFLRCLQSPATPLTQGRHRVTGITGSTTVRLVYRGTRCLARFHTPPPCVWEDQTYGTLRVARGRFELMTPLRLCARCLHKTAATHARTPLPTHTHHARRRHLLDGWTAGGSSGVIPAHTFKLLHIVQVGTSHHAPHTPLFLPPSHAHFLPHTRAAGCQDNSPCTHHPTPSSPILFRLSMAHNSCNAPSTVPPRCAYYSNVRLFNAGSPSPAFSLSWDRQHRWDHCSRHAGVWNYRYAP